MVSVFLFKGKPVEFDPFAQNLEVFKSEKRVAVVSSDYDQLEFPTAVYAFLAQSGILVPQSDSKRVVLPYPEEENFKERFLQFVEAYLGVYLSRQDATVKVVAK